MNHDMLWRLRAAAVRASTMLAACGTLLASLPASAQPIALDGAIDTINGPVPIIVDGEEIIVEFPDLPIMLDDLWSIELSLGSNVELVSDIDLGDVIPGATGRRALYNVSGTAKVTIGALSYVIAGPFQINVTNDATNIALPEPVDVWGALIELPDPLGGCRPAFIVISLVDSSAGVFDSTAFALFDPAVESTARLSGFLAPEHDGACLPVVVGAFSGLANQYTFSTELTLEDIPVPTGDDVPMVDIPNFFVQAADSVVVAGTVDAHFCVGHDPRYRMHRGRTRFRARPFRISEMSHTGSCGDLSHLQEIVPASYHGYPGRFPTDETGMAGVWFVVADIEAEGAIFDGPLVAEPSAEALIDFTDPALTPHPPACNTDLPWRQLVLGGDFENGQKVMTVDSVQCNAPRSMTRRTTYLYPTRLDSTPRTSRFVELINLQRHFATIGQGIKEIRSCAANETVAEIWSNLLYAQLAFVFGRREEALEYLEQGAFAAKNGNFNGCPPEENLRGRLMGDLLSGAFTVFDRYLRPKAGATWEIYLIPAGLELPLVVTDAPVPPIP